MKKLLICILLIFFFAGFFPVAGQFVGKPCVVNYDKRIYGGGNQNWSVAAATGGLIYFGNDEGLLEFDGSSWDLYKMPDNGVVRSVSIGAGGNIYVGSYQQFGFWRPDKTGKLFYTSLSDSLLPVKSLHNDEIWRIIQHDGKVYFQSFSNIFVYNGQDISILNPGATMVLLIKSGERLFVHLVARGLYEIIDDTFRKVPGSEIFTNNEIKVVLPFGGNQFLIGASGLGLYLFNGSDFRYWDSPVNEQIRTCELNNGLSGNNRLIIGTVGSGIFILDSEGNLVEHLSTHNFLQNNTVLSVDFDSSGDLWAGLDRGIDLIDLNAGMDFYVDPSGTMGSVYTAVLDGSDLLVGTNQGLYRYSFSPGVGFIAPELVPGLNGQVWDLKSFDGEILCGHNSGTFRVMPQGITRISDANGGFEIKRIQDRNQDILMQSTYSTFAVYTRKEGYWKLSKRVEGFYEPITSFETDHLGNVWGAHATRGIFRIRMKPDLSSVEGYARYGKEKGLPGTGQTNLAKIEGRIVFPSGEGVYLWDDLSDTIVLHTQLNEQLGDFYQASRIIKAGENQYWFIRDNDIALYRITGFETTEICRYDLSMQGLYLTRRFTRIIPLKNGLHLVCLDNGFALFDEYASKGLADSGTLSLRRAVAMNRNDDKILLNLDTLGKISRIPYSYRSLNFHYASGSTFRLPLFRTWVDGLDQHWSAWTHSPALTLNRLPWGEYRLRIESRSINGKAESAVSYPFIIRPPWYFSNLAFVLYAWALVTAFLFFRMVFLRRLRHHKDKIEREEAVKREQEVLLADQELIRLKSEKLEAEVNFKNVQLADFTMSVIKRNEQLIRIRDEFQKHAQEKGSAINRTFSEKISRLIDHQLSSEDDWQTFETHFDQAHQDFIKRLKVRYPHLTQSDLKLCAYLRLNITTKEIAHLLNISIRGVEVRRYRLRKRLSMSTEENLYEFLLQF